MADLDLNPIRALLADAHPADAHMACADCCPMARTRTALAATVPGLVQEVGRLRMPMVEGDLTAILAAARAAKEEAGSGSWFVGERWMAHTVVSGPGEITSADESPRALISANSNFPSRAILDHIAVSDPNTVIALVAEVVRLRAEVSKWYRAGCDGINNLAEVLGKAQGEADALRARVAELETELAIARTVRT